jgi:hypothetical protein
MSESNMTLTIEPYIEPYKLAYSSSFILGLRIFFHLSEFYSILSLLSNKISAHLIWNFISGNVRMSTSYRTLWQNGEQLVRNIWYPFYSVVIAKKQLLT